MKKQLALILMTAIFIAIKLSLAGTYISGACKEEDGYCSCQSSYQSENTCYYGLNYWFSDCANYGFGCEGGCYYEYYEYSEQKPACNDYCSWNVLKTGGEAICTSSGWQCNYTNIHYCTSSNQNVKKECGGKRYVCDGWKWIECKNRNEDCNNGIDDDCNGKIDYCDSDCECNGCVWNCKCYPNGKKVDIDDDRFLEICCDGQWKDCSPQGVPKYPKKDCNCCSNSDCGKCGTLGTPCEGYYKCVNNVCSNECETSGKKGCSDYKTKWWCDSNGNYYEEYCQDEYICTTIGEILKSVRECENGMCVQKELETIAVCKGTVCDGKKECELNGCEPGSPPVCKKENCRCVEGSCGAECNEGETKEEHTIDNNENKVYCREYKCDPNYCTWNKIGEFTCSYKIEEFSNVNSKLICKKFSSCDYRNEKCNYNTEEYQCSPWERNTIKSCINKYVCDGTKWILCQNQEICDNGVDDDCDESVDEGCGGGTPPSKECSEDSDCCDGTKVGWYRCNKEEGKCKKAGEGMYCCQNDDDCKNAGITCDDQGYPNRYAQCDKNHACKKCDPCWYSEDCKDDYCCTREIPGYTPYPNPHQCVPKGTILKNSTGHSHICDPPLIKPGLREQSSKSNFAINWFNLLLDLTKLFS